MTADFQTLAGMAIVAAILVSTAHGIRWLARRGTERRT